MTSLTRLLHPTTARRAYSSFFSSKAGGGRYFNPAKPPKTQAVPRNSTAKKANNVDRSAAALPPNSEAIDGFSSSNASAKGGSGAQALPVAELEHAASTSPPARVLESARPLFLDSEPPAHPVIGDKDLKIHQFFSLHRPLLLLSNPTAILHSSPGTSIFSLADPNATATASPPPPSAAEQSPQSAAESDAEAARQLARAIAMNHAGASFAWEETLRRLGLDPNLEADRVGLQQQLDKEFHDVMMDSVKRKRRKKMKKHKLKKRRRATRSQRLKMR